MSCLFCKIVSGAIPCFKVYETSLTLAFLDINPLSTNHILIIPKSHGQYLHHIDDSSLAEILVVAKKIASSVFEDVHYNLLQNNGRLAHQEVDHVHFHLIPKRENEGLEIGWKVKKMGMEELKQQAAIIQSKLANQQ